MKCEATHPKKCEYDYDPYPVAVFEEVLDGIGDWENGQFVVRDYKSVDYQLVTEWRWYCHAGHYRTADEVVES